MRHRALTPTRNDRLAPTRRASRLRAADRAWQAYVHFGDRWSYTTPVVMSPYAAIRAVIMSLYQWCGLLILTLGAAAAPLMTGMLLPFLIFAPTGLVVFANRYDVSVQDRSGVDPEPSPAPRASPIRWYLIAWWPAIAVSAVGLGVMFDSSLDDWTRFLVVIVIYAFVMAIPAAMATDLAVKDTKRTAELVRGWRRPPFALWEPRHHAQELSDRRVRFGTWPDPRRTRLSALELRHYAQLSRDRGQQAHVVGQVMVAISGVALPFAVQGVLDDLVPPPAPLPVGI